MCSPIHTHNSPIQSSFDPEDPKLSDIFRLYGDSYRAEHRLSLQQVKAIAAIKGCQTEAMGCRVDVCEITMLGALDIIGNFCENIAWPE
ncbi:transposase zinc-binding domain-containing protein [Deltaproteobacteria bacterium TL4]